MEAPYEICLWLAQCFCEDGWRVWEIWGPVKQVTPGAGPFWPQDFILYTLDKGLQAEAAYQVCMGLLVSDKKYFWIFAYKSRSKQNWSFRKKDQGFTKYHHVSNIVEPMSPMLHTKPRGHLNGFLLYMGVAAICDWPSDFLGKDVWRVWMTDGRRSLPIL